MGRKRGREQDQIACMTPGGARSQPVEQPASEKRRQLRRSSNHRERESRSQNDQCIYAGDHDAEKNAGHQLLGLEFGFSSEHDPSPYICHIKHKMGIRSEEMSKTIPMYLVPRPFDQIRPLTGSIQSH
jgi:hypothetical protein